MNNKFLTILALCLLVFSCNNDDDAIVGPRGAYDNGILIANQGNFGRGNTNINFQSNDGTRTDTSIFEKVNGRLLGDVLQSIAFNGDFAYLVVNNSGKIEVVDRYTFESVATIDTGLYQPRYMTIANGKGYVTDWGEGGYSVDDDFVAVIDLNTNTVSKSITVNYLPERIITANNNVYVATGIFGNGDKVQAINANTDEVASTITVGTYPNSLQTDANNNVWVLSSGASSFSGNESAGRLVKINTTTNTVDETFTFETTQHPGNLVKDGNTMYYQLGGSIYKFENNTLPTTATINDLGVTAFYGMTVNNGNLYVMDAKDYASNGDVKVFNLSSGSSTETITTGISPGGVYFN